MKTKRNRLLKNKLSICIIFLLSLFFLPINYSWSEPVKKIHVLFVGNSLTSANDLPKIIAELAKSRKIIIEYDMHAPGGYTFSQHATDPALQEKIRQGNWDFVVLQEQSQMPAYPNQVEMTVYPYAKKLCQLIRQANPKARIVFYMTMARKNGDTEYAKNFPAVGTYAGMQKNINTSYLHMAQQNHSLLAPVGIVWQNVRLNKPMIELYGDDKHPNITGSYLAACVFYALLFKDSPVGLPHPKGINDADALYLQTMTQKIIQSQPWHF
jgi:hypothetical protein